MAARWWRRAARCALFVALVLQLGCATLSYYTEAAAGHIALLEAARPIDAWLADPTTPEGLRVRLVRVRGIRRFASEELHLPDNTSYASYASIDRPYVVWNVFVAPELSLDLREWCFPIAGCVTYRGYFSKEHAEAFAAPLREQGLDVMVGGVPAYSTLGHTPDPVLSTFISYPDAELARLIFHELAHQEFYLPGDSTFNESFASTVEAEGVRRWLAAEASPVLDAQYRRTEARRGAFLALVGAARTRLEMAYRDGPDDAARRAAKKTIIGQLRADYARERDNPASPLYREAGYDRYFAEDVNNASLAAVATYTQRVPAFVKLLEQEHGDLSRFYQAVKALGALEETERDARLDQLQGLGESVAAVGPP